MNVAVLAIGWCVLAQLSTDDPYGADPSFVQRKGAPTVRLDPDDPAEAADDEPRRQSFGDRLGSPRNADEEILPRRNSSPAKWPDESDAATRLSPVDRGRASKMQPPELLAEALDSPVEGAVVGKPITLTAALLRSANRQQQLKIAQAYWRLSAAQAGYHWARDARERLVKYTEDETSKPETLSARAAARADVVDSQLAVVQAQQELAEQMGTQSENQLALAGDRPHVGGYDTHYEEIFSGRAPPPRIQLIHRTLSLRRKAIDLHAEAIVAALDVLSSVGDDFIQSQTGLSNVLSALDQLAHERQAFMAAVRSYNQDIAEYLMAVAPADTTAQTLSSRLILKTERSASPPRGRADARSSSFESEAEPTPRDNSRTRTEDDQDWTSRYRPEGWEDSTEEIGTYQGLSKLKSPVAAQKLAAILHWDRALPDGVGQPTSLADCLRAAPAARRNELIRAYWNARQQAACYQAAVGEIEQLNDLSAFVVRHSDQRGMADAGVRVQAARRAALAARTDAHLALLAAEFDLTVATGKRVDGASILPVTLPQAGGYDVGNQASRREPFWAARVRLGHQTLQERADAVLRFDAQRADLTNEARQSRQPARTGASGQIALVDQVARAITNQHQETLAFLRDVTEYNLAIAGYALAVMPPATTAEELVKRLVVARNSDKI